MDNVERQIRAQVIRALGAEPDLLLLANAVGLARHTDDRTGKTFAVPYGLGVGSPDLVGILRASPRDGADAVGVWFCLELKQPGERPETHQAKCHAIWQRFGALVYVVTSVDEARRALADARSRAAAAVGQTTEARR